MAQKKNAFTPALKVFLEGCGDLAHLLHFTEWQNKIAVKRIDKSLEAVEKTEEERHFLAATRLSIVDVFHDGKYITRAPSVQRTTGGKNVKKLFLEMEGRVRAQTLVSLHEILEDYLIDSFGLLLYQLRNENSIPNTKAFHKGNVGWAKRKGVSRTLRGRWIYVNKWGVNSRSLRWAGLKSGKGAKDGKKQGG